jgi:hypothetical protein
METRERKTDEELWTRPDCSNAVKEAHHDEGSGISSKADQAGIGAAEKKLVRKLDMHLIPLVMALYLFSFLDR